MKKNALIVLSILIMSIVGISAAGYETAGPVQVSNVQAPVKAMTFNIRVDTFLDIIGNGWGGRKKICAETISRSGSDVIGLQEAKQNQVRYLENALPEYACYKAGRNNGKKSGETCAILYRKGRFNLADSGTFWFSNRPHKPGSKGWGNIPPRICSWVYLKEKDSSGGFYVYNVHLDNLSQKSRARSVELLAKMVSERKTDDPFIVMGDFNMEIDNPAMRFLCQSGCSSSYPNMVDAWQTLYPTQVRGTGTRHGFNGKTTGPRIDHIPVCASAKILDVKIDRYNVNGKYPSDHFPVAATIAFQNDSPEAKTYLTQKENKQVRGVQ